MTVKSLTPDQKRAIANSHCIGEFTLDEMVVLYKRSRRTIFRVLEEQGCAPAVRKRNRKPTPVVTLPVVIPTKTPWWKRINWSDWFLKDRPVRGWY